MTDKIIEHPDAALMAEVTAEQRIVNTPEACALQEAIFEAMLAYYKYLDANGMFCKDEPLSPDQIKQQREEIERGTYCGDWPLQRASAVVATCNWIGEMDLFLKDGPNDRRYGRGEDPDFFERGLNPMPRR
jgi:hypothetical protein